MPVGVLGFTLPPANLKAIKAKTEKKFWRRHKGYRTQFEASYKHAPKARTNVKFPFVIPSAPK